MGALLHAKISIMSDLAKCPICKREIPALVGGPAFAPFCSARCRSIDLGNWLEGGYRIAANREETEDEIASTFEEEEGK